MWVTIVFLVLVTAVLAVLLLLGNILYAILEELRDNTEETRALRPPAPWVGKLAKSTEAMRRGTEQV